MTFEAKPNESFPTDLFLHKLLKTPYLGQNRRGYTLNSPYNSSNFD